MTKRHKCKEESWYHTPFILANINFCKDKNEDFNNKFRDKFISLFAGIGNNMNVYNKLMNLKMNKRCKNKNDNFRYYNSDKNIKGF